MYFRISMSIICMHPTAGSTLGSMVRFRTARLSVSCETELLELQDADLYAAWLVLALLKSCSLLKYEEVLPPALPPQPTPRTATLKLAARPPACVLRVSTVY